MIYFYWMTGLGFAITLAVAISSMIDNRSNGNA